MTKAVSFIIVFLLLCVLSGNSTGFTATASPESGKCAIPKFEQAFERADAVFAGTVLGKKSEGQTKVFELAVERYWKGIESTNVLIHVNETFRSVAQFEVGESYLVFAEKNEEGDGKLFDRRCSRTKPIDNDSGALKNDLEKLGEAKSCISLIKK